MNIKDIKQKALYFLASLLFVVSEEMYWKIINSSFWYNIYYKNTKEHKKEINDTRNRVLRIRSEILNKRQNNNSCK